MRTYQATRTPRAWCGFLFSHRHVIVKVMDRTPTLDDILSRPQKVYTQGPRKLADRPLADRFKSLVRTGTLSALLLIQAVQGVQAGPLVEHLVHDTPQRPVATQVAQAPEATMAGIELVNPLEGRGLDHVVLDNGMSGLEVIRGWRDAGVEPAQILQLTQVLLVTQSPVLVRNEQDKRAVMGLSEQTAGLFSLQSQDDALAFLKENSLRQLETKGLIADGASIAYGHNADSFDQVMHLWDSSGKVGEMDSPAYRWVSDTQTAQDLKQSVEGLKQAVSETGLKSLRVPLPMWSSSQKLDMLSSNLVQANKELQQVTGWEGQVLGLKGNVNLMAGSPYGTAAANCDQDFGYTVYSGSSTWDHEVFHIVDCMLAKDVGGTSPDGTYTFMSQAIEKNGLEASGQLGQAWAELEQALDANLGSWRDRLHSHASTGEQGITSEHVDYATSSHEKIAYAFEALAEMKLGRESSVISGHKEADRRFSPDKESAKQSLPAWEQAFSSLNEAWWSKLPSADTSFHQALTHASAAQPAAVLEAPTLPEVSMEVSIPSMGQWRQSRNPPVAPQSTGPQLPRGLTL